MYCDLNLRRRNEQVYTQLLTSCLEDNYEAVACSVSFKDVILQENDQNQSTPIDRQKLDQMLQSSLNIQQFHSKPLQFQQYSRVTIEISESKYMHQLNDQNKILQSYDLIAVKPKTDKILASLCQDFDYFDIVTFDCFDKLVFIPKRNIVAELINKGIFFELNYSDALQDQNKRRIFMSNAMILIKATKGKNLIISSNTEEWLYHRSPYDLVALGITLGLKKDCAFKAVNQNPFQALQRAKHRKAFKGTITVANQQDLQYFSQKQEKIKERQQTPENISGSFGKLKQLRKKIQISKEIYRNVSKQEDDGKKVINNRTNGQEEKLQSKDVIEIENDQQDFQQE